MGIDGLIFLDNTGRPIIQSGFRASSTAYPLLHVDAYNNACAKAQHGANVDPVLYVQSYGGVDGPSACCHVPCGDMRLLCPISGDVDPLYAFAFLQTFIEILQEYFGSLSAATLKENFDVAYQLLEETLDSGGHPLTTSPNVLRDIVLPPSLWTKLLNVAGASNFTSAINAGSAGPLSGPFSSPVPWRKAGLRYANNEVYFDVVEEIKAIVNKHGTTLSSNVWGKIETNARLSGTPDCTLTFSNSHILTDCAFHPCVRLQRWNKDKALSFIPPDGRFTLMEYRYNPNASSNSAARFNTPLGPESTTTIPSTSMNISKDVVPVPFSVKITFEVEENGGSFNITLSSRLTTRSIENMRVEFHLGEGASGVKCVASRGAGGGGFSSGLGSLDLSAPSNSAGTSWMYDTKKLVLRWEILNVPPSSHWNLSGSYTTTTHPPRPSHALQFTFGIPSHTFSSLKVDQFKIAATGGGEANSNNNNKLFKGVRGRSLGNVEWRW
ncbi:hypothetical protein AX16_000044 [Volvariella volvacea WC 439]|nr:hypothetical protein AX16_000044 [Volvariella volvacea WC 439]